MRSTKEKLLAGAADTVRQLGISGTSARSIADRADVNQALIFYHFGTVSGLVEEACNHAVDEAVSRYQEAFSNVTSLTELLQVGRDLHDYESTVGNVAIMAQLMSNSAHDESISRAAKYAMNRWSTEIETVVVRLMKGSPLSDFIDGAGLGRAIAASFIGIELYDGIDPIGSAAALASLERLGLLVDAVNELGPVARSALRAKTKGISSASSKRG
jgi:AcrR family transcriptional regulator